MTRTAPRQPRVLYAIAALFCLGAVFRLAPGVDAAFAAGAAPAASSPEQAATDAAEFLRLSERAADIDTREARLAEREAALAQAQQDLRQQLQTLVEAEAQLSRTMDQADSAAEGDITQLARVFEAMRPEQASAVFAEMDPVFAAGFLARLAPEVAASILAGLEPRQAYAFSALLAGRNATTPRRD